MRPQMKVQTTMAAYGKTSHRFSAHKKNSLDLSTQQQLNQQQHHQHQSMENACKSGYSNHTISPFTPPPSPSPKNKLRHSQRNYTKNRSTIHILTDELIDMYEQTVQQCTAAENRYKRLDLTMKSTLKLQTKTYEHCIEELNGKIERLQSRSLQHLSANSDSLNRFMDGYASEFVDDGDGALDLGCNKQIEALKQQILLNEQSAQQTIAHYLGELERERLETKHKDQIIAKQDDLITTLETKLQKLINQQSTVDTSLHKSAPSKNEKLLEAQIELQAIELEDKKKLLTMLIHERDELSLKVEQLSHLKPKEFKNTNLVSTLNVLQTSDSRNQKTSPSLLSSKQSHAFNNHLPPPPSPPPKSPLPPTPRKPMKPPPRSYMSTRKSKPRRLNADQHQSGVKSWSGRDFETATNGMSGYYIPPSSSIETPIYQALQEPHEWRRRLVQDLMFKPHEKMVNSPNDDDDNQHANGFTSLLKSWKRHAN